MRYLSIKNLAKRQHYKNRRPPWIKLHADVLDDYHFGCLQDASKAHLMLLWVLASKSDNKIPYDLVWISQKLQTTSPIDVDELVLQGFIEVGQDDSMPLASRKQNLTTETEGEKRQSKRTTTASGEADSKRPESKLDILSQSDCESLRLIWGKNFGAIDYPRFRKAILPAFQVPPEERPAIGDVREAIIAAREWWEEQDDKDQGFFGLDKFVQTIAKWIRFGKMPIAEGGVETERGKWAGSKRIRADARQRRAS